MKITALSLLLALATASTLNAGFGDLIKDKVTKEIGKAIEGTEPKESAAPESQSPQALPQETDHTKPAKASSVENHEKISILGLPYDADWIEIISKLKSISSLEEIVVKTSGFDENVIDLEISELHETLLESYPLRPNKSLIEDFKSKKRLIEAYMGDDKEPLLVFRNMGSKEITITAKPIVISGLPFEMTFITECIPTAAYSDSSVTVSEKYNIYMPYYISKVRIRCIANPDLLIARFESLRQDFFKAKYKAFYNSSMESFHGNLWTVQPEARGSRMVQAGFGDNHTGMTVYLCFDKGNTYLYWEYGHYASEFKKASKEKYLEYRKNQQAQEVDKQEDSSELF